MRPQRETRLVLEKRAPWSALTRVGCVVCRACSRTVPSPNHRNHPFSARQVSGIPLAISQRVEARGCIERIGPSCGRLPFAGCQPVRAGASVCRRPHRALPRAHEQTYGLEVCFKCRFNQSVNALEATDERGMASDANLDIGDTTRVGFSVREKCTGAAYPLIAYNSPVAWVFISVGERWSTCLARYALAVPPLGTFVESDLFDDQCIAEWAINDKNTKWSFFATNRIKPPDKLRLAMLYALRYEDTGNLRAVKARLLESGLTPEKVDLIDALLQYSGVRRTSLIRR